MAILLQIWRKAGWRNDPKLMVVKLKTDVAGDPGIQGVLEGHLQTI